MEGDKTIEWRKFMTAAEAASFHDALSQLAGGGEVYDLITPEAVVWFANGLRIAVPTALLTEAMRQLDVGRA